LQDKNGAAPAPNLSNRGTHPTKYLRGFIGRDVSISLALTFPIDENEEMTGRACVTKEHDDDFEGLSRSRCLELILSLDFARRRFGLGVTLSRWFGLMA
jgi:hypothetical protein